MIEQIVKFLRAGGIVIFPTETVYALACDASNVHAQKKIYEIKKRHNRKALPVMVDSLHSLCCISNLTLTQKNLVANNVPGPFTFVVVKKNRFERRETIAIRIPRSKIALRIIKAFGRPICATSVNISGYKPVVNFRDISPYISKKVKYIICDNQGVSGRPSSVIDISDGNALYLRKGKMPLVK